MFSTQRKHHLLNPKSIHLILFCSVLYKSVYFNNARASVMDIEATNGVIHLIDEVLDVPEGTIYAVLRNPEYPLSTFADLVDRVSLNRTLDASGSNAN